MSQNKFTTNNNHTLVAVSNADGETPVYLYADPATHGLILSATLTGGPIPASGATAAVNVQIVDGSGNQITSFGGGTQYTDGGVPPAHPIGPTLQWSDGANWQTVSTAKPLPVTATISTAGLATSVKQSDGSQKTQIVDGSGNVIAATSNALNSFITNSSLAVTGTFFQATQPVSGTVTANAGTGNFTVVNGGTFAVQAAATLSAETTKVIGVVRNADGAGNLLTSTANALDINIKSGSIANTSFAATQATASSLNATVVGTGTFAVQATLAAETTKIIGTVNQGTSPWVVSNSVLSVVGNGAAATAQRVTLANDSTGIIATVGAVTAITNALPAGTNLLGKVGIDQTTPGTTNAVSANQGTAAALASGWVVINGEQADTTGTFTNATQTTSVTATNLAGYGNVLISINGTFGTASAIFEGSDDGGANWYTINEASRTDSSTIENGYTSLTNTTRAWQTNNPGWDSLRVRSTAVASGTVNVRISPSAAPSAAGATVSISGTVVVDDLAAAPTGSAVPANAQYDGLLAQNALPTAATPGNLTGMLGDKFGRPIVLNNAPRDIMGSQTTTITSSTAETTIITQAASIFNDLVSVFISNTSATAARVDIRDTTGGSIIFQLFIPAGDMRGLSLTTPWPQTTVNNNWTAQSSASVADLRVSALFVKNK